MKRGGTIDIRTGTECDLSVLGFSGLTMEERWRPLRSRWLSIQSNGDLLDGIVKFDVAGIGSLAEQHLTERGFTSFAFVGDMRRRDAKVQLAGFQDAINQRREGRREPGCERGNPLAVFDAGAVESGESAQTDLREWLRRLPKPTGILCANEILGYKTALATSEQAMSIPSELAIVVAGNDPSVCQTCIPPLSGIDLDFVALGVRLGEVIAMMLDGVEPDELIYRPVEPGPLFVRASTDFLAGAPAHVLAALKHIRAKAGDGINVKMVARYLGISRRKLERDFHRYVGGSPRDEIRRHRARRIEEFLRGNMPLSRIAKETGFSSAQYMARFFRSTTGSSVQAFRQRKRGRRADNHD
jgi:LacI family transcriptional regulator